MRCAVSSGGELFVAASILPLELVSTSDNNIAAIVHESDVAFDHDSALQQPKNLVPLAL